MIAGILNMKVQHGRGLQAIFGCKRAPVLEFHLFSQAFSSCLGRRRYAPLLFLAAGFFATGFFAAGFFAAGFLAAGFFATGFFATGFFAAGFFATGF
ncbi:MAG: hypothetical protein ABI905_17270, partial [Betaproteobacteria bacterium]